MTNKPNIRASEIKQWDFCPRQWYLLRTKGRRTCPNNASRRGLAYHQQKAGPIRQAQKAQSFMGKFAFIGGVACLLWLLSLLHW